MGSNSRSALKSKARIIVDKITRDRYPSVLVGYNNIGEFKMRALILAGLLALTPAVQAEDMITYEINLKGATFDILELKVPAGKPFMIKMNNQNAAPAELEAKELDIEKIAAGNSSIVVRVKAQKPGKYLFVDEFQEDVAKAYVIVE